jgi:DNA-binding MarR family transcriptional regulator
LQACTGLSTLAEQVNMAGPIRPASNLPARRASPLFLREPEIRRGIELMYFGYSHLTRSADAVLDTHGLGRAHHRALYFIARQPGLKVGDLLRLLAITKQSLGRVLTDLTTRDLVTTASGEFDRRQKLLRLTAAGAALEGELFEAFRERLSAAYAHAGQEAVTGFWQVLEGLVPPEDRALVLELSREG